MAVKTNAMRVLDAKGVSYQVFVFSPEIHSAEGVAEVLGLSPQEVYKTLVILRERGRPLLVMMAGNRQADLRRLARGVGEKTLRMAHQREAEQITGLQVGGISALALLGRGFDVYIDRPALDLDTLLVSAGRRGVNVRLAVKDLLAVTGARPVEAGAETPTAG